MKNTNIFHFSVMIVWALAVQSCSINRAPIFQTGSDENTDSIGVEGDENQAPEQAESDAAPETDVSSITKDSSATKTVTRADAGAKKVDNAEQADAGAAKKDSGSSVANGDEPSGEEPVDEADTDPVPPNRTATTFGDWTYYEVEGAFCRDGSPAGYYFRKGTGKDLMIFLNGGGVCYDDFFCSSNPANVNQSLPGESLMDATIETFRNSIAPERQVPPNEGILKPEARNPVSTWSMVYVPYCTGDSHGGTTTDAEVVTSSTLPPQQFVGYTNIGLFYRTLGAEFRNAEKILLTGSSAGGLGALLNYRRTQQFFKNSRVIVISDSGVPFSDKYQEVCLQKIWRQLWGLDAIIPEECDECFHQDGGGLVEITAYNVDQNPGRIFGGIISSKQDEVMKLFYSAGLYNCEANTSYEAAMSVAGRSSYPIDRYPAGLKDYIENVVGRTRGGSYIVDGSTHQHLFRPRFYEKNGSTMTLAQWVADIIAGKPTHIGELP
jgi:hypothetical protein